LNTDSYSWVHDFGSQRQRKEPLKKQLHMAQSAEEWINVLRENTLSDDETFENLTIHLVCGTFHGQSVDKLAGVISESLHDNPMCGKIYAFCNKMRNNITTFTWKSPVFNIAKYIKVYGTFIWPSEDLGKTIEVTKAEFDGCSLLTNKKKPQRKSLETLIQCVFHAIIKA